MSETAAVTPGHAVVPNRHQGGTERGATLRGGTVDTRQLTKLELSWSLPASLSVVDVSHRN